MEESQKNPIEIDHFSREVTDPKNTEQALLRSEERCRQLFEHAPAGIFEYDFASSRFVMANDLMCEYSGLTKEEILSTNPLAILTDESQRLLENRLKKMVAGEPFSEMVEYSVRRRDGRELWIVLNTRLIYEEGVLKSAICVAHDITERKHAGEDLRNSEQSLSQIINFLPDATFVIDIDGKVIAWNRAIEEMTGVKAEAILGKGDYEYALPFYGVRRPVMIDLVNRRDEGIEAEYAFVKEQRGVLVSEAYIPGLKPGGACLYNTASPLCDSEGKIVGAIESIRDITDRRRAEEALKESEERYRLLVEHANDAVFIVQDGQLKFPNPKAREMGTRLGIDIDKVSLYHYIHPEDRKMVAERHVKRLRGEDVPSTYAFRLVGSDKSITWVELNAVLIHWEGKPATLSFLRDVTRQRDLETQLRHAQKMEAIGTLAGGIAHDFNNILMPLIAHSELALLSLPPESPQRVHIQEALKAADRAKDLVKQILTFGRQTDSKPQPLRMSLLIKETLRLLKSSLPSTIEIRPNIESRSSAVLADPTEIHQVMMNLCTNAAHAMRDKGGVLEVQLVDVDLEPGALFGYPDMKAGPCVKLTVSDTGHGIDPAILDRIFEPYFTTKANGDGSGMGLAIVHRIVKACEGTINVQSGVGKGTTFEILLPRVAEPIKQNAAPPPPIPMGRERILFVDDEKAVIDAVAPVLERLGYNVQARSSGMEALEAFRNDPWGFDLIITDQTMPKKTGKTLAQEIMRIRPDVPVILCTGFSEEVNAEKAKELGIRSFLMKPIDMRHLAQVIREVLAPGS